MSILQILQYPDLRLRRKGHQITDIKSLKIQKIIDDMIETLINTKNCAGLSATQLDIEEPPSITTLYTSSTNSIKTNILCLLNPRIIKEDGSAIDEEGCMSIFPQEIHAKIKRATTIQVSAIDPYGNTLEFEATDDFARCIQHECDHLQGVLYIDHLSKLNRSRIDKKIAKLSHRCRSS